MHIVVCGTGYTGSRVVERLPTGKTTALGRTTVDLDNPQVAVPSLPVPWSLLYTVPPAPGAENDERLERFLNALATPPCRIVYLSTSGVYGDRQGAVVTEQDSPTPLTARAKRRLAAEKYLSTWCDDHDCERVVLRVPAIYGPGRLGLERIRAATPIVRTDEAAPGNRIHVDDLASCCLQALDAATVPGVYNLGDGDHRSSSWFAATVADIAGLTAPLEIPMAEATRMFSESRLSFLQESRRLDTSKMREVLGVVPRYEDATDGIRASLKEDA